MTATPALRIAPRVILYDQASPPPVLAPGELALARIPACATAPAVFGDGSHPTTRLCAAALDLLCRQQPGAAVLDVGTGTGVLARIARARQASFVAATDIDPAALDCARAHAALEAAAPAIHFSSEHPAHWSAHWAQRFDLVAANILEAQLAGLAAAIYAALRPGGRALLSGITRAQVPSLRLACERAGLNSQSIAQLQDWVLLSFCRPLSSP